MSRLGVFAATAAACATVVALPATEAHAQQFVPCSATALRSAINLANTVPGPAVLFLSPGCTYTLTAPDNPGNGLPVVTSDINILGAGSTIRRQSATDFRLFKVSGPTGRLTLNNLTVRDGRSASGGEGGGGIHAGPGTTLTLNNVEVTRNFAGQTGPGGGILSYGTLTLRNSTVSYNITTNTGGGVSTSGATNISNTTITGNTAKDDGGGLDAANGSLTLTGSRVTDNAARFFGAGINTYQLTGTVTDTLIRGNSAAENAGGGVYNRSSTLTLERTTVFANRALSSGARGGGLANASDATLNVRNSSVTNNFSHTAPGGIFNDGGTVTLTATPVTDNYPTNCAPSVIAGCVN
ncbi:right-handed parallel beta-helix repeat-containing protein [Streptomyces sp. APSN-46.1]|uniref:right-handed parallel beta-helix repeat-containing protein n=1 Tax=Streptomyces sp. APSN-46.1 TaxID=2929049 RepID=UPI001FB2005C|nr:right-handed parallel beta-helix repeat-containing protein [Streptomyces sp. APSN-46.1]MCJ1678124.1 right-handed parallel beta-helix repeat-containing protein [Streptomyces sp. APSN-46.1]